FQRAFTAVPDYDLFQAVAHVYAVVGVAGDPGVFAVLHRKLLAEPRENRRRHGVQHVALGKESLPQAMVANRLRGGIDLGRTALVDHRLDAHSRAAPEQRFELAFVVIDRIQRTYARHAD